MEDRLKKKNKIFAGNGIAIWTGHHILLARNRVHDCAGSGVRSDKGDYITMTQNEVYNNTWYTSSASSAIVIADARSVDRRDSIKMRITNNLVYDNYNLIPFFINKKTAKKMDSERNSGSKFGDSCGSAGRKNYGCAAQDYIIDGQGVYFTRNTKYRKGWWLFANNVTYGNGINGVVVHHTDRAIVTNNVAYMNGATPLAKGR